MIVLTDKVEMNMMDLTDGILRPMVFRMDKSTLLQCMSAEGFKSFVSCPEKAKKLTEYLNVVINVCNDKRPRLNVDFEMKTHPVVMFEQTEDGFNFVCVKTYYLNT